MLVTAAVGLKYYYYLARKEVRAVVELVMPAVEHAVQDLGQSDW